MTNSPSDIPEIYFNPAGKNKTELENDLVSMLDLFNHWDSLLKSIKKGKKNWKDDIEAKKSMNKMVLLDSLWKRSRKRLATIGKVQYEEVSIIQHKMETFLNKRREIREKLRELKDEDLLEDYDQGDIESKIMNTNPLNGLNKENANENKILRKKTNFQMDLKKQKGKQKKSSFKQISLEEYINRKF